MNPRIESHTMQKQFLYMKSGMLGDSQEGPVNTVQLAALLLKGTVKEKTPVCVVGTTNWVSLGSVKEVMDTFHKLAAQERARAEADAKSREEARRKKEEEEAQIAREKQLQQQEVERREKLAKTLAASTNSQGFARPATSRKPAPKGSYWTFDRFVTPSYIKVIWILSNIIIGLSVLSGATVSVFGLIATIAVINERANASAFDWLIAIAAFGAYLIGLLIGALLILLVVRVSLECVMVAFRCSRSLDLLAGQEPPFDEF